MSLLAPGVVVVSTLLRAQEGEGLGWWRWSNRLRA